MLVNAIPDIDEAGVKTTNAVVLNRGAQHIRKLKDEDERRAKEVDDMKEKISKLNTRIAYVNLPHHPLSAIVFQNVTIQPTIQSLVGLTVREQGTEHGSADPAVLRAPHEGSLPSGLPLLAGMHGPYKVAMMRYGWFRWHT